MEIQIKAAIITEMSTTTKDTMNMLLVDLEEDLYPITQTLTMTNEESTPMEVDTDPQKKRSQ